MYWCFTINYSNNAVLLIKKEIFIYLQHLGLHVCELLWRNREQVEGATSFSLSRINSAGYLYPIQSLIAFLSRSRGTSFDYQRPTLTIIKGVALEPCLNALHE